MRKNTIAWLIEDYLASNTFASKVERTRGDYRYYLEQIKEKFGSAPISDLEPPQGRVFIYRYINRFSDKPRNGNHFRALFSVICSHAPDQQTEEQPGRRRTAAHHQAEATVLDVRAGRDLPRQVRRRDDAARVHARRLHGTPRRRPPRHGLDAVRSSRKHAGITAEQDRRPVAGAGASDTARFPRPTARQGLTILTTRSGKPFREDYFRHRWRDAILQAGLDGLRFQDLRRTAVVRLAEAGCTDPEIAAITGHSLKRTKQILETYLPRTPEMARNAMAKWESKPGTRVGTHGEQAK